MNISAQWTGSDKSMKTHMETRHKEKYIINHANTERYKNSPIIYMQRLLNEQEKWTNNQPYIIENRKHNQGPVNFKCCKLWSTTGNIFSL